jgi:hypothetical protein
MIFGMLFEVNSSMVGAFTLCDTPMVFLSAWGKCQDSTSIMWQLLPSKSFPIHQLSYPIWGHVVNW